MNTQARCAGQMLGRGVAATALVAAVLSLPGYARAADQNSRLSANTIGHLAQVDTANRGNPPPAATGAPGQDVPGAENSSSTATGDAKGSRVFGTATGAENASAGGAKKVSRGDRAMMEEMAFANAAEMAAANVALSKAQSPEVKKYAKQMLDDHTNTTTQLQTFAKTQGVNLPAEPDPQHQSAMMKMKGLDGKAFDQAYLEQNVTDHRNTLRQLHRVSKGAENKALRDMAARQLPVIEHHLMMAERMAGISSKSQPRDMQGATPPSAR